MRPPDPTSAIAQERVQPGIPELPFLIASAVLAAIFVAVSLFMGINPTAPLGSELAASASPAGLLDSFGLHGARIVSSFAGAVAVGATAFAARRLLHSDSLGILAGLLVALDPAFLVVSRLALPDALAMAGLLTALACFLAVAPAAHWVGAVALALATAADPRSLIWGAPIGLLVLLRGHIYAAPRHLGLALFQAVLIPAVTAALHLLATGGNIVRLDCLNPASLASLGLRTAAGLGGGIVAIHNPATWYGGLGALLFLAIGAIVSLARQFRVARLPGRIQLRLADPLAPVHARALWLGALAIVIPFPAMWLPIFAIALAAGIGELSEDAPGFGLAVALVSFGFALLGLIRLWPLVAGGADASQVTELLRFLPWVRVVGC